MQVKPFPVEISIVKGRKKDITGRERERERERERQRESEREREIMRRKTREGGGSFLFFDQVKTFHHWELIGTCLI